MEMFKEAHRAILEEPIREQHNKMLYKNLSSREASDAGMGWTRQRMPCFYLLGAGGLASQYFEPGRPAFRGQSRFCAPPTPSGLGLYGRMPPANNDPLKSFLEEI